MVILSNMDRLIFLFGLFAAVFAAPWEKGDLTCEVCHIVVEDLKNLIAENKTQADIESRLEDVCNRLTADVDICLDFVKSKTPTIFAKLVQNLDPEDICILLEVCPKEEYSPYVNEPETLVHEPVQDEANPVECEICKLLIVELDRFIKQNASTQAMNKTVFEFCNKLPSALKTFCLTYEPQIVKALEAGLDPQKTCEKVTLCSSETDNEDKYYERLEEFEGPLECELCKLLVTEIDSLIVTNRSIVAINSTVYNLCNNLPGSLQTFCLNYAPDIVAVLSQGVEPTKACEIIKLCTQSMPKTIFDTKQWKMEEQVNDAKCDVCEFLVQTLDQFIGKNATKEKINATMYQLCDLLPAALKATCQLIAPSIIKEAEQGFDPLTTCQKLKICDNNTETFHDKDIENVESYLEPEITEPDDAVCEICQFLIELVDQVVEKNSSYDKINSTVFALCGALPDAIKVTCDLIAPKIVQLIASGVDPQRACVQIQLCTNNSISSIHHNVGSLPIEEPVEEIEPVQAGEFCELCEFVIQLVDSYLEQNASSAKINETVFGICNVLPAEIKVVCDGFAPKIVSVLESGLDPKQACTYINLCTNGTSLLPVQLADFECGTCMGAVEMLAPAKFDEEMASRICSKICVEQIHSIHRRSTKTLSDVLERKTVGLVKKTPRDVDWECQVCTWLAEAANIFLKDNKTEENIANNLNSICKFLPAPYDKSCKDTTPIIIKELESGLEPKKFCQEVMPDDCKNLTKIPVIPERLLARVYEEEHVNAKGECNLCLDMMKLLRNEMDQSTDSIRNYLQNVCERMPSPTKEACATFVSDEYEAIAGTIIRKLLDPEETCHLLKICV